MKKVFTFIFIFGMLTAQAQQWYSQLNSSWSGNLMNNQCPISSKGCLITDIAMLYNGNWNPGQINSFLNTDCGYSGCGLYWSAPIPAGVALYGGPYNVSSSSYLSSIASHMNNGRKVVLEFTKPNGNTHWVQIYSITGSSSNAANFNVYDPGVNPYQARTLANSAYSTWSPTRISVYQIGSTSCLDNYEPNNSFSQAYLVSAGSTYNAVLCTTSDVDYYKFNTTSAKPKFKVTLQNLPTNYQLEIYKLNTNGSTTFINSSTNGCRTNEAVVCNSYSTAGTYIAKIYGANSFAYHARLKYDFKAVISSTPLSITGGDMIEDRATYSDDDLAVVINNPDVTGMTVFPNPVASGAEINLTISNVATENAKIEIFNLAGSLLYAQTFALQPGDNIVEIQSANLPSGLYFVRLLTDSGEMRTKKLVVGN